MSETTTTQRLQVCLDRMLQGDAEARKQLFGLAYERLTVLARKVRKDFPSLGDLHETGDILHDAYPRLHKALEQIAPQSVRDFYGLAALQIRRVLIDLCRRLRGRRGQRKPPVQIAESDTSPGFDVEEKTHDPSRLAHWAEFHEAVDKLPPQEREVVDLLWYQELSQEEAAEVLGVDKSTVKRRWRHAREKLAGVLE